VSSVLHPVGPERRTTYWKRRLVVVLVLLALLTAVVLLVRGLGSGDDPEPTGQGVIDPSGVAATVTGTPSGSPTTSSTTSPTTSPTSTSTTSTSATSAACGTSQLEVTTSTDASVYGPNVNPQLKVVVANTAAAGCDVRVGAGTRTLVVRDAGGAAVWSSADCSPSTAATTGELLAAGQRSDDGSDTTAMTQNWSRERSAPGCPTGLPAVEAGTYTLTGTWGGVTLPATSFTITPR
jgi:hypothetical protein